MSWAPDKCRWHAPKWLREEPPAERPGYRVQSSVIKVCWTCGKYRRRTVYEEIEPAPHGWDETIEVISLRNPDARSLAHLTPTARLLRKTIRLQRLHRSLQ